MYCNILRSENNFGMQRFANSSQDHSQLSTWHFVPDPYPGPPTIKRVIDCDGATCWNDKNAQPFWTLLEMNSLWCFLTFFSGDRETGRRTDGQTDRQMDVRYQTYYLPCFAVDKNRYGRVLLVFLRMYPTLIHWILVGPRVRTWPRLSVPGKFHESMLLFFQGRV